MYQIDNATALTTAPTPPAVGPNPGGHWTSGNPGASPAVPATTVDAWFLETVQAELCLVVTQAGQALSKSNTGQVAAAIALVSDVVGSARNLAMSVTAASASATLTADEIVVSAALGGLSWKLGSFSETINLATTGAGGMDTGTAPASGYVAVYAIYNPSTGAAALLATNATGAAAPSVYGAGHMPAGYTASALVSVWPTTSAGLLQIGHQFDREHEGPPIAVLFVSVSTTVLTLVSIPGAVPLNARKCSGYCIGQSSVADAGINIELSGSTTGVGEKLTQFVNVSAGTGQTWAFEDLSIITPQTIYYNSGTNAGTLGLTITLTGYQF